MTLPSRPRLCFRVGFAGRKDLPADAQTHLTTQLQTALQAIGQTLAEIAPGVPVAQGQEPRIASFYASERPLLRLVTGLCEGADLLAGKVLQQVQVVPDAGCDAKPEACLETELAAVLPFATEQYRASRPADALSEFDDQLARCAYVLELDGIYAKPNPDTDLAKRQRARAYRAQSAFLLRHVDLLIAAANLDEPGKAGGTLETLKAALVFELPVLFIHTGTGAVYLIAPEDELAAVLDAPAPLEHVWKSELSRWVRLIVADPDLARDDQATHGHAPHTEATPSAALKEYFDQSDSPDRPARRFGARIRAWAWSYLEKRVAKGAKPKSDPPLAPYADYRKRATALNYHYSAQYRGAFVLNYTLAVIAVLLATISLLLLGAYSHTPALEAVSAILDVDQCAQMVCSKPESWLLPLLIALAVIKLGIVIFIAHNTRLANSRRWNDRAVDMRYLAERIRALFYLPQLGSFQPPAVYPPQFAARVVRQSHIDWLCEAIVRGLSPAQLPAAQPASVQTEHGPVQIRKRIRIEPAPVIATIHDHWVAQQAVYHQRNAHTMHALHEKMEHLQKWLGYAVIAVVALDIVLIGGKLAHKLHWITLPGALESFAKTATPWLIAISAILPAIIAALGGLRFQSECQRLAERSDVMRRMLSADTDPNSTHLIATAAGTAIQSTASDPPTTPAQQSRLATLQALHSQITREQNAPDNPGSHAHAALNTSERIAKDFAHEAAEWSVLYAKELGDPG
jgi:hypothetical protein